MSVRGKLELWVALGVLGLFAGGCKDKDKAKQEAKERALASLPYMNSYPVTEPNTAKKSGVVVNEAPRVQPGLNLFGHCGGSKSTATKALPAAVLLDQEGNTLHTWSSDIGIPVGEELDYMPEWFKCWSSLELTPNGDLLVISGETLLKLDWDSNVVWRNDDYFHHEVHQSSSGDIYALASKPIYLDGRELTIVDNHIVALTADGKETLRLSLYDILSGDDETAPRLQKEVDKGFDIVASGAETLEEWNKGKEPGTISIGDRINGFLEHHLPADAPKTLKSRIIALFADKNGDPTAKLHLHDMMPFGALDPIHANSVFVLPASEAGLWQEGDFLVSIRELDLLAIINPETKKIVWQWYGPQGETMHHATLLANGNFLVFENGAASKRSRVLEIDPAKKEVVWSYPTNGAPKFFSPILAGAQRLPNGNTLIADATNGHALEVTADGAIVWEYYNEAYGTPPSRDAIYRMERILPPLSEDLLSKIP